MLKILWHCVTVLLEALPDKRLGLETNPDNSFYLLLGDHSLLCPLSQLPSCCAKSVTCSFHKELYSTTNILRIYSNGLTLVMFFLINCNGNCNLLRSESMLKIRPD